MYQGTPLRQKRKTSNNTPTASYCDVAPFHNGERVYVKNNDSCWISAVLKNISNDRVVSLTNTGKEVVCGRADVLHCTSGPLCDVDRLSDLAPLNEATVLYCLGERLEKDCIYTRAGSTVVAVNPFRDIKNLYTLETVSNYHGRDSPNEATSPHIYEIAEEAYCRLQRDVDPIRQCIIVSGESGAGKTVSAKHLLRYLTVVANPLTDSTAQDRKLSECTGKGRAIERRILDSNPILEAFGNAATPRNDNSSRFGKFVQLQFQKTGHVGGASIETYLLEKTRLVHQGPGDCNFHVFYQLCTLSGMNSNHPEWLNNLVQLLTDHSFNIVPLNNVREKRSLQETLEAMSDIGLTDTFQQAVFRVVMAILFLCNIDFTAMEEDFSCLSSQSAQMSFLEKSCLELSATCQATVQCCSLLGTSPESLEQVLLNRSIASGGDKRRSVFVKPVSIAEAKSRRDCLAMLLYSRLFDWLVDFINQQIKCEGQSKSIGLLDIYGFEMFDANSLEQLCINYANEKLQQHYVRHFLKDLQREYEEERIAWQHIDYRDNQPCLDVLEMKVGVLGILNEEVYLNRKSNTRALGEKVLNVSQKEPTAVKRPKTFTTRPGFIIQHYAGDVRYDVEHITTKNKDNIPVELVSLLQQSDNTFLSHLFEDFNTVEASGKKKKTVLTKFKASLDELMSTLKSSDVHYIRCIKPNRSSQPGQFEPPYVLQQLKANGILETVEICRRGYSTRLGYWDFLQRYGLLLRDGSGQESSNKVSVNKENSCCDPVDILLQKNLDQSNTPRRSTTPQRILRRRTGLSSLDHTRKCCAAVLTKVLGSKFLTSGALRNQFGKNKIFLLQQQFEKVECARNDVRARYARVIQRTWHCYTQYQDKKRRHAVTVIWKSWRMYKIHKEKHRCDSAARCIQRAVSCWLSRTSFHRALETIKQHKILIPGSHRLSQQPSPGRACKRKLSDTSIPEEQNSKPSTSEDCGSSDKITRHASDSTQSGEGCLSEDSGVDVSHSGSEQGGESGPPVKKLKLSCTQYTHLQDMHVGDGVVTRRKVATRGMRFHTRESVLKNAHIVHRRELQRGLTDCLMDD